MSTVKFTIEIEQEQDQRWIAEVLELPGVMTYGSSPDHAKGKVQALALSMLRNSGPASSCPIAPEHDADRRS